MNSQIFVGTVRHRRFTPVKHAFEYPMFMPFIDLDELATLNEKVRGFGMGKWKPASFFRDDYLGQGSLKTAVQDKVEELTGERVQGRVMMLCHLRYFGFYFSPVNFYYLYDERETWRFMLAEVSNTPWNERHYYAIPAGRSWENAKMFHVSPFNPISQTYQWKLREPKDAMMVHLEAHQASKEFDATLVMKAQPFDSQTLSFLLRKTPMITLKTVIGIYWQAFRLWIKKAPFYDHPGDMTTKLDPLQKIRSTHVK
ncbi:DUF1365 domain-containing protein [Algicola sagamiensis]|uniref:DUF1365 domain-containing protein n=1 Tax=Algicola sagamiensis TaxID=163869 RepID=UPI00037EF9F2|nr:DUF1365 domain-containing protein [Algicola sagamiensis]